MKIPTNIKPKLNILISYYRNLYSKTDERFMSKNFVYDDEGLEICTIYTLSRIEHNKTNSYDNIYYSLLDNLHTSYVNAPKVDKIIHTVNLSLLKLAERNHSKLIIDRISKTINTLLPYLNYIIYKEQAEIYQILLDYYQDYKFNTQLIDKYNKLFEIVDEPLKPILIEIISIYYTRITLNANKAIDTLILSKYCTTQSIITDYLKLLLSFRLYKLPSEKEIAKKLIKRCEKENNKYYLNKTYNILASLYTQQNPNLAIHYLEIVISNFDLTFNSKFEFAIYLRNLGVLLCMNKKYYEASQRLRELFEIYPESILTTFYYFIISTENIYGDINDIRKVLNYTKKYSYMIDNPIIYQIFKLFDYKYNDNHDTLLNNIIYELFDLKDEILNIPPLMDIIDNLLFSICKIEKIYDSYKLFANFFISTQ